MSEGKFKLFSCCIPIRGINRSIIYDLQRNNYSFIPNGLFDILKKFDGKSIDIIKKKFKNDYDEIIDEYFLLLEENEYIFFTNEPENFPDLNLIWEMPSLITNAIIDINNDSNYNYKKIIEELDKLNCKALQFRFFKNSEIKELSEILENTHKGRLRNIELVISLHSKFNINDLKKIYLHNPRISCIYIYSSPEKLVEFVNDDNRRPIIFLKENICNHTYCGKINPEYFFTNITNFTESQHHNTCLNRKVCIDVNGEIKNCPSMTKSYGNTKDTILAEAIEKPGFKDLWFVNKDKIDVCKDCEFRYMCTDCRAFIKDSNNIYSQPAKCPYNPYIAKWEVEEGYVPVDECGTYSKETGFVVNKRKVNKLNKQIWGE